MRDLDGCVIVGPRALDGGSVRRMTTAWIRALLLSFALAAASCGGDATDTPIDGGTDTADTDTVDACGADAMDCGDGSFACPAGESMCFPTDGEPTCAPEADCLACCPGMCQSGSTCGT